VVIVVDRSGGCEDLLRSLGAVLDELNARAVTVRDVPLGLLVRAQIPSRFLPHRESFVPLERVFTSPSILEAQVRAVMRRGTDHTAGPIEQSLRVVGRRIDENRLQDAIAIQGAIDGQWSVWHRRVPDGRIEVLTLTSDDLQGFGMLAPLDRGAHASPMG
jgi:hypothetical protein